MYPVTPEYIALRSEEIEKTRILSSPGDPLTEENVSRLSLVENGVDIFDIRGGAGLSRAKSDTSTGLSGKDDSIRIDDWDNYRNLKRFLPEYQQAVAGINGYKNWNDDQKKVHKLGYMRGLHPMIPSWWRMNFRMWGITQEEFDHVFTSPRSHKRVAIHAYGSEVDSGKALESLFYLSQSVKDAEQIGNEERIGPMIVKTIRQYYRWALRDIGLLEKFKVKRSMIVKCYYPGFHEKHEQFGDDSRAGEERQQEFTEAVTTDLERRLKALGGSWRKLLWNQRTKDYAIRPPTLYAFAVIQHIVMLVSLDSADENKPFVILDQIALNDRGAWLWNALSIAIPINMIRDTIHHTRHPKVVVLRENAGHDPDA